MPSPRTRPVAIAATAITLTLAATAIAADTVFDTSPAFQLDRNGDGRVDRLVGRPKGKPAGIYAVTGTKLGKRIATVRSTVDPTMGRAAWTVKSSLVVTSRKVRWRAVSRSALTGAMDRAPGKGFRVTRWARRGC